MNGLLIKQFSTGYPNNLIIQDLCSPLLKAGEVTILLGPNGSGKSTLLRGIAGLNARAKGQLLFDNNDLMKVPFASRAKKIVYLPQSLPDGIHLRVMESILVAQRASGNVDISEEAIISLLERLSIDHLALCYLGELSGGQRQLVGLAQSLIRKPSLLLLDEPLSALDLNYQVHVMDLVRKETQAHNMITVVVVHDINIALKYADSVLMLKKGELIAAGKPDEVITSQSLAQVYGVKARVESCSQGIAHVLVDGILGELE